MATAYGDGTVIAHTQRYKQLTRASLKDGRLEAYVERDGTDEQLQTVTLRLPEGSGSLRQVILDREGLEQLGRIVDSLRLLALDWDPE